MEAILLQVAPFTPGLALSYVCTALHHDIAATTRSLLPYVTARRHRLAASWSTLSNRYYAEVCEAAVARMGAEDAKAARRLEAALGQVCRTDGIASGAFAETEAHAGYARHHGASRANALSSLLLLDLIGKEAENASAEYAAIAALRRSLFLPCRIADNDKRATPRTCRILALGGGPGFEAAALESVASFVGSTVDIIEVWVADNEPQWQSTCMAVSSTLAAIASKRPTRSSAAGPTLKIHFVLADVTKSLDAPENEAIAPLVASLDLVLFSYVLVETAAPSRVGGWQLLRNLGQRLPFASYVIALDATHRVWPEAITALRQGAGRRGVAVWLPTWRNKIRLIVRIGAGKQEVTSTLLSMTPVNLARCVADANAASTSQRFGAVTAATGGNNETRMPPQNMNPGICDHVQEPSTVETCLRSRLCSALASSGAYGPLALDFRPNVSKSYSDDDNGKLLKLDFRALREALLAEDANLLTTNSCTIPELLSEIDEAQAGGAVAFEAKRSLARLRKFFFSASDDGRQVERELAQLSTYYFTDVVPNNSCSSDPADSAALPPSFEHGSTYVEISRSKAGVRGASRACSDVLDIANQLCSLPRCPASGDEGGLGQNGTAMAAARIKTLPSWLLTMKDVDSASPLISTAGASLVADDCGSEASANSPASKSLKVEERETKDDSAILLSGALTSMSMEVKCADLSIEGVDDASTIRRSAALVLVARGVAKAESIRQGAAKAAQCLRFLARKISETVVSLGNLSDRDMKTEQLLQSLSAAGPVIENATAAFAAITAGTTPVAASSIDVDISPAKAPNDFFGQARSVIAKHRPSLLDAVLSSKATSGTSYNSAASATTSRRPWTVPGKASCSCCQRMATAVWLTVVTGVCIECISERPRRGLPDWRKSEKRLRDS